MPSFLALSNNLASNMILTFLSFILVSLGDYYFIPNLNLTFSIPQHSPIWREMSKSEFGLPS